MLLVLDGKTNNIMLELSCFHNSCFHVFHSINGLSIPVGVSLKASAYKCIKANCSSSVFFCYGFAVREIGVCETKIIE